MVIMFPWKAIETTSLLDLATLTLFINSAISVKTSSIQPWECLVFTTLSLTSAHTVMHLAMFPAFG